MSTLWVRSLTMMLPESAKNRLRTVSVAAIRVKNSLFKYKRIVILRASITPPNTTDEGYQLVEHKAYVPSIAVAADSFSRKYPNLESRFRKRFDKGMRYYELRQNDKLLGTAWFHPSGYRYIDEMGYLIPVPKNNIWLRDLFIAPDYRGMGLFSRIVNMALNQYYPHVTTVMSDTEMCNKASMAAHNKCGFKVMGSIRAVHVANYFMLRDPPLPGLNATLGYKIPGALCVTGNGYRDYCSEHIA